MRTYYDEMTKGERRDTAAYAAGAKDFKDGKPFNSEPFTGDTFYALWEEGYRDAEQDAFELSAAEEWAAEQRAPK